MAAEWPVSSAVQETFEEAGKDEMPQQKLAPVFKDESGKLESLDEGWLARRLHRAGCRAGMSDPLWEPT